MSSGTSLDQQTRKVAHLLRKKHSRLVLAESCTGGLLAAAFTEIPGISEFFCGSQVVYRENSKTKWLGVKAATLKKHSAVSRKTAEEMVHGVLKRTPEAKIAASITGYLGPTGKNVGQVFISVLERGKKEALTIELDVSQMKTRLKRREHAAIALLLLVRTVLEG